MDANDDDGGTENRPPCIEQDSILATDTQEVFPAPTSPAIPPPISSELPQELIAEPCVVESDEINSDDANGDDGSIENRPPCIGPDSIEVMDTQEVFPPPTSPAIPPPVSPELLQELIAEPCVENVEINSDDANGDGGTENRPPCIQQDSVEAMDTQEVVPPPTSPSISPPISQELPKDLIAEPCVENDKINSDDAGTTDTESTMIAENSFRFRVLNIGELKAPVVSPAFYVQNLPWKIIVELATAETPVPNTENRSLGFFLQCNGENESSSWWCKAMAELRLLSYKPDQKPFVRLIEHVYLSKERDWGYSHFIFWHDLLDPANGYIQDDAIELEVLVLGEVSHGVSWDSKKHSGYVGLKNQGATCYMNSLLQTLYFTNKLREAVYKMPTEADDSSTSMALALQRIFYDLQFSEESVCTKVLTRSFGWDTLESVMQHDVQEFLRVLLDKLETKMSRTSVEGTVPRLFEGKMSSFVKCKNVNYTSARLETFYDIQLNIKGKKNIAESFRDYIDTEILHGDNKYDAGEHGLQEAEKGVIFVSFPPVLHLHLMRFQYDPITDNSIKCNDRFEFDEHISLDEYLLEKEDDPADYTLQAVLAHSGDNHGGHYVGYIDPLCDGKWCKFNDAVVSQCRVSEAIKHNYGGAATDDPHHCSNAYMLVYIRGSAMQTVLQEIKETDIPTELSDRLQEEHRMAEINHREYSEANQYMTVNVLLEEYLEAHQTTDLFDQEKVRFRVFKMRKTQTVVELMHTFVVAFLMPVEQMRVWTVIQRHNQLTRLTFFDYHQEVANSIINCAELQNPWTVFLEMLSPDSMLSALSPFNKELDVLLFFKFYDPLAMQLHYCGLGCYNLNRTFSELVPEMNKRADFPKDTELTLYNQQAAYILQRINNHDESLESILLDNHGLDGIVIIFEKKDSDDNLELSTCENYFCDLFYRIEVTFIDKSNPNDLGFSLELSQDTTYDQMAATVGRKINVDMYEIQFFKCQNSKDVHGQPLPSTYDGCLKDLLIYNKSKRSMKIFYRQLPMNIIELERKSHFKCTWLPINMKEEKPLSLYADQNGTVKNLLDEAAKQIVLNPGKGSGQLRILEISRHRIMSELREDDSLEYLQLMIKNSILACRKTYRIEEIPGDEINLLDGEQLIPVSHFYKEVYNLFGIPFFVKMKRDEPFAALKERIRNKIGVPDKEWETYKFALVNTGRVKYITDEDGFNSIADLWSTTMQRAHCYLGLEHKNKSQRIVRFGFLEKAIKIYN